MSSECVTAGTAVAHHRAHEEENRADDERDAFAHDPSRNVDRPRAPRDSPK
jgi:hypothetical protein